MKEKIPFIYLYNEYNLQRQMNIIFGETEKGLSEMNEIL